MRRWTAAGAVLAALLACSGSPPPAASPEEAARRGLAWILAHRDAMPDDSWIPVVVRIHRVVVDDAEAERLAALARERLAARPPRCAPEAIDGSFDALYPLLAELVRCVDAGEDVAAAKARLAAVLPGAAVWRDPAGHQIVVAHRLERLGIAGGPTVASLTGSIRRQCETALADPQRRQPCELYALTHVVLTASDYLQRRLDASAFPVEVRMFREAMRAFRAHETDDLRADVLGEILLCYKVLGVPLDPDAAELERRLVARQNPDGSWGSEASPALRAHSTAVLSIALREFAPELRADLPAIF